MIFYWIWIYGFVLFIEKNSVIILYYRVQRRPYRMKRIFTEFFHFFFFFLVFVNFGLREYVFNSFNSSTAACAHIVSRTLRLYSTTSHNNLLHTDNIVFRGRVREREFVHLISTFLRFLIFEINIEFFVYYR